MDRLLQARHPQHELAGEIQESPSRLNATQARTGSRTREHCQCHGTCQEVWSPNSAQLGFTHTPREGGVTCRSCDSGGDSPLPLTLTATGGQAWRSWLHFQPGKGCHCQPWPGVTDTSQRDSYDFIPSFLLFQFPVIQFAKQPLSHPTSHPALCHGPWGTRWRSLSGQFPPSPHFHSPLSHSARGRAAGDALLKFSAQTSPSTNQSKASSRRLAPRGHVHSSRGKQELPSSG